MGSLDIISILSSYLSQFSDSVLAGRSPVERDFADQSRLGPKPTQPPVQWVLRFLAGGKAAGAWR